MRIFWGFLIILTSALLWLVPVTEAVYNFRTDLQEDLFGVATAVGSDNATVVLSKAIYDDDTSTISVSSNLSTDAPLFYSYNSTSRATIFTGLTANATHTLTIEYDKSALSGEVALDTVMDLTPYFWYLIIIAFPMAGLVAIVMGYYR